MYFGMKLRELGEESNPDPEIHAMVQYAKAVVSALGWRYCIAATETAYLTLSLCCRHLARSVSHGGDELRATGREWRSRVPALSGRSRSAVPRGKVLE